MNWAKWVWCRLNIPKQSFIAWLVMMGRLNTKAKLHKFGVSADGKCPLCNNADETIEHLFFTCPYSSDCCSEVKQLLQIKYKFRTIQHCSSWVQKNPKGWFTKRTCQSILVAVIYNIWKQRNDKVWNNSLIPPQILAKQSMYAAITRILSILPQKTSKKDRAWLDQLYSSCI